MSISSVTPTIAQYFIPEIWANRALEVLRAQIVLAKRVLRDSEVAAFTLGDVLHIPYPGTFTANDKTPASAVTLQTPANGAEVQVTLNKHKEVSFLIEDVVRAQQNQEVMDRYIESAVVAIAEKIETDIWAEAANFTHSVSTAGTDIAAAIIRSARSELNTLKAPLADRTLVVSPKDEISILGDSTLQYYFANARPEAVAEGSIGRAYGFDIFMSQLNPAQAGTPITTSNLAFNRGALVLAMRGLPAVPQGFGAESMVFQDPLSQLVIRITYGYNMSYTGIQVTLDVLYGVKVLRDEKAVKVIS